MPCDVCGGDITSSGRCVNWIYGHPPRPSVWNMGHVVHSLDRIATALERMGADRAPREVTPPRYDDVYHQGTAALDAEASGQPGATPDPLRPATEEEVIAALRGLDEHFYRASDVDAINAFLASRRGELT